MKPKSILSLTTDYSGNLIQVRNISQFPVGLERVSFVVDKQTLTTSGEEVTTRIKAEDYVKKSIQQSIEI
jgi:hypothetical protein